MLEDDDVIFEGHELDRYLREQGYTDYEVVSKGNKSHGKIVHELFQKTISALRNGFHMIMPGCQPPNRKAFASLQSEIQIILNSGLLLEADCQCVSCLLEPDTLSEEKPPWKSVSLLYGIGLCVMTRTWRMGLLPWLIPAVYTCVAAGHFVCTWYVYQQKKRLAATVLALLHVLKEVSSLTRRVILFIQENELLLRGFTLARSRTAVIDDLKSLKSNWYLMAGLRERIAQVMLDIIDILKCATKGLVRECPLKGQLDHEHNYAAFLITEDDLGFTSEGDNINKYSLRSLKRLQSAIILLQSEFLRRFALCCMTSLWSNEFQSTNPLLETVSSVSQTLGAFVKSLTSDYKFYSCYGKGERNVNKQMVPLICSASNVFVGVHSARLYMQGILHKIAQVEQLIDQNQREDSKEPDVINYILNELDDITHEITSCSNCIEIALSSCKSEPEMENAPPLSLSLCDADVKRKDPILVGYSDFNPQVEDEVFEALIHDSFDDDDDDTDIYDFKIEEEDEQQRECSKRMLSELKIVLVHKAEEMKKREDRALRNKGALITEDSSGCEADAGVSEDDTSKSEVGSELLDFIKSEINSSSINMNHLPLDESWSRTGLPLKPLGKTLVGQEETFGDSSESDGETNDTS